MKMKNVIASAILALGAVAAPFAASAADQGSIYSIDLVDDALYGGMIPTEESPLLIGQKAVIRVRLLNANWADSTRTGDPQPWKFYPTSELIALGETLKEMMSPKLGLMLGGQPVYADFLEAKSLAAPAATYTDLYFAYTVKSGDLAMPAHLMNDRGQAASSTVGADYALLNLNYWELKNARGDTAVFHFYNGGITPPAVTGQPQNLCVSGLGMGLYVKTVDFDKNYAKPAEAEGEADIWRQIYRGMTTTTVYGLPTVAVEGNAESATTLYVWVDKDEVGNTVASPLTTDGAREVTDADGTKRIVLPVSVPTGVNTVAFKLKGITNGTVTVKMSSTEKLVFDDMNQLVTNWVERVVQVVDPPDPFVSVELLEYPSGKTLEKNTVTLTADYENPAAMIKLTLSQEPSADLTVELVPDLADGDVFEDGLLGVSEETEGTPWEDDNLVFTFHPGGSLTKTLYVYAKGTTKKFSSTGCKFTAETSGAPEYDLESGKHACNLIVKHMKPLLVSPTAEDRIENVMAGKDYPLDLVISDARKWMVDAYEGEEFYTVYYRVALPGIESEWAFDDSVALDDADTGTATVSIPFDVEGEGTVELYVKSPSGQASQHVKIPVTIEAPKKAWATLDTESEAYAEGQTAQVRFHISQKYKSALYAFLVPLDDDAKTKFVTTASSEYAGGIGCYIAPGDMDSTGYAEVAVNDGKASGQYEVFMCTTKNYSKTKPGGYVAGVVTLNATNVVPRVKSVTMGGQTLKLNGGVMTKAIAQGVEKKFTVEVDEPGSVDLDATGADVFRVQWKFGTSEWQDMDGNPNLATVFKNWTFSSPGEQTVTVRCQDKDMRPLGKWSDEFTFTVTVLDIPKITITPVQERKTYYEDETGSDYAFNVKLSAPPEFADSSKRLKVYLTVTDLSTSAPADVKLIELSKTELEYPAGMTEGQGFFLVSLDGTAKSASRGYRITASVNGVKDDELKTWDSGEVEVYVVNRPPQILSPSEKVDAEGKSTATATTIGTANSLTWSAKDVEADQTGMTVMWETSEGSRCTYHQGTGVDTETDKYLADVMSGTHTFRFASAGKKSITLTVTDKDGETDSRTFYYEIDPSKTLKLIPHGPTAGMGTSLSKRYRAAAGIGEGRVYAGTDNLSSLTGFEALYNCGLSKNWTIYAYGYKVGETSGHVGQYPARENPLDANGDKSAAGGYAYPDDERDSYLYTWLQILRGEEGGGFSDSYLNGSTAPEYALAKDAGSPVSLPDSPGDEGVYDETIVEAIFAKEFLWSDNMGDINQDGIPDIYVDKYGFGVFDGTGKVTGDDLQPVTAKTTGNTDGDYLPATETSLYGSLIPNLASTWVALGKPFDARMEIRGAHDGLNDAPEQVKLTNVKPDRVYEVDDGTGNMVYDEAKCTISYVEYLAWCDAGKDPKWSPERPTDPTTDDTDGDDMPDGYEYWFWYRAHVGYMVGDVHRYQTGRRYNPKDPANPTLITPSEIERIMDPLTAGVFDETVDTDNDGIPDKIEFEIGTNPFEYDTDGDELPDGYELYISLTDPLDPNNVLADPLGNPDGDAMAYEFNEDGYRVYGVLNDRNELVYRAFRAEAVVGVGKGCMGATHHDGTVSVVDGAPITNGWKLVTAGDEAYYTAGSLAGKTFTHPDGRVVLTADLTESEVFRLTVEAGGEGEEDKFVLGMPAHLLRGTVLKEAPTPVAEDAPVLTKTFEFRDYKDHETILDDLKFERAQPPPNRAYAAYKYGNFMLTSKLADKPAWGYYAICGDAEIGKGWKVVFEHVVENKHPTYLIHHVSYQDSGFDPRTAWSTGQAKSRSFTTYDEYLALPFHRLMNERNDIGGLLDVDITQTRERPWSFIWKTYLTDPHAADSDSDGMPDGWELYVMAGPMTVFPKDMTGGVEGVPCRGFANPRSVYGPIVDYGIVGDKTVPDKDDLDFRQEFCGVETCAAYPDVATIVDVHPEWRNKKLATDPWNADTDGDGLTDGEEGKAFIYGEITADGAAGGGLNPCSWDTDNDGLPDPWELEFQGSYVPGEATTKTETKVDEATGATNTVTTVLRAGGSWEGGMDGTVADADLDYDHDGLQNWQEYIAGTIRAWRYDDTVTPWDYQPDWGDFPDPFDEEAWGEWWFDRLINEQSPYYNPHWVTTMCDNGAPYMSLCTNEWDGVNGVWYYFRDGVYHDLKNPPRRYILNPGTPNEIRYNRFTWKVMKTWMSMEMPFDIGVAPNHNIYPSKYISCDPRLADTDGDGMDDYYELFHGMNPLLGADNVIGSPGVPKDIICEAYDNGIRWSSKNNYWYNGVESHAQPTMGPPNPPMDFVNCPWLNGLADADPDGDDIRNQMEAIMPNIQAASTYLHTDPTPQWMTDPVYSQSLVNLYFASHDPNRKNIILYVFGFPDGFWYDVDNDGVTDYVKFADFGFLDWEEQTESLVVEPYAYDYWRSVGDWFYSFEQDEGYDTDQDFLSDFEEAMGKTTSASDPLDADQPRRRQAMYFDGQALLSHPLAPDEMPVNELLATEPRQNYLYYTVECWAKPEDPGRAGLQTLVERSVYVGEANPHDAKYLRKNFLLGIRDGRWYTKFDTAGTSSGGYVDITDGTQASNRWTHVAASYDGHDLKLYVDGVCVRQKPCGFQPEHAATYLSLASLLPGAEGEGLDGVIRPALNDAELSSFTVGASSKTILGLVIDYWWRVGNPMIPKSQLSDFEGFYRGYIDEIRVWDGARDGADILADVKNRVRYTRELALENREKVYAEWVRGGSRLSPTDTTRTDATELPAQLMHHWSFDQLPGATDPSWALRAPTGFSNKPAVLDSRAVWCRPSGWKEPWWYEVVSQLHSKVYDDYAFVPWIPDTVAHLPRFDLTTLDSIYWSENYAGDVSATSRGFTRFAFPRSCEPVSKWFQLTYGIENSNMIFSENSRFEVIKGDPSLMLAMSFAARDRHLSGDDLLPLGNAYPKRISADEGGMWDEQGAADAWGVTKADANIDFLPDWWVTYAKTKYYPGSSSDPVGWDTTVRWPSKTTGTEMPAWQAYLRDLARGMLPDKKVHPEYADTRDLDGDKLPDWWEDLYGVQGNRATDGMEDPDHDGLSNYQEWMCGEGLAFGFGVDNGYPLLDPKLAHTGLGQDEVDYFLTMDGGEYAGWYLGEILADHDMMEDDAEDEIGTDRTLYDAWSDYDEDGWTAWSELRYSTFKMSRVSRLVSHMVGTEEVLDSPVPVVHATLRYNGDLAGAATAPVVVQAYAGNNLTKKPTATYTVHPGESMTNYVYLGAWEKRVVHGTLTPGHVQSGFEKVSIEGAFIQANDRFSWTSRGINFSGTYADLQRALADDPALTVNAKTFDGTWDRIVGGTGTDGRSILQLSVDEQTQKGWLLVDGTRAGTIDLVTGDFTLDLSKLTGTMAGSGIHLDQYVYRLGYYSMLPTLQTKALSVSLAGATTGALKEGVTAFVAFVDLNRNGAYDPDEPIGFAKDVEIGWDQVPSLTIEMTDKSAAAGKRLAYGGGVETLRIIRTAINGSAFADEDETVPLKRRIVYNRDATTFDRRTVFEGDLVTAGKYGLDWTGLRADILSAGLQLKDVTSVTYQVVKNAQSVDHVADSDVLDTFEVTFPAQPTKPTAVRPSAKAMPIVESVRPTFAWSGTDDNTAFALMICDAAGNEVWSNTNTLAVLPPRDASGNYTWTAPVWIGTNACGDAWALSNGSNYTWKVAMFNAKFSKLEDTAWSDPAAFRTALATDNDFRTSYGTAKVTVRYFGPATNDLSSVLVCLYRTADFTGVPAAQTRLFETNGTVRALADGGYEVRFLGLETGDYYAMAYVDRNGSLKRDRWETWGYANQIGYGLQAIYTPVALAVDAKNAKVPSVTVYMEDTDVNQDDEPDCLTADESVLSAASATTATDDGAKDDDGDGLTADEEASDSYTDATKWDTDEDQMPDGWESRFADLDPLFGDAEAVLDGDVMAYAEVTWRRVTDAANVSYLVNPTNRTISVGDTLTYGQLVATYDYGGKCGVGTNLCGSATFKVDKVEEVTAVLVHAQVFDEFGFDPLTAVFVKPDENGVVAEAAVNTKPFTALDKYLVVRYLEAQGLANEEKMNLNRTPGMTWKDVTLKPLDPDNDRDGVADGWELYVMFGTNGVGCVTNGAGEVVRATSLAEAKISPWNPNDARAGLDLDGDGLNVLGEFNGGKAPMNPWNAHTLSDAINDRDAFEFNVASAATQLADDDGDGLSNWAEYLAARVYGFGDFRVDDAYSARGDVMDYFVVVTNGEFTGWYVGEVVADHDFMDDAWEDLYDVQDSFGVKYVNRYVYDAAADGDSDGWSNWAEARAGTDPSSYGRLSLVRSDGAENNAVEEFPIPRIHMKLTYDSDRPFVSPIVVKAWGGSTVAGAADAVWHVAGAAETEAQAEGGESEVDIGERSRFIGLNPCKKVFLNIGPGAIAEGHVKLTFYDPRYAIEHLTVSTNENYDVTYAGKRWSHTYTWHTIDSSNWAGGNWWPDFPADKRFGQTTGVIKHGSEELAEGGSYEDTSYEVVGSVDYKTGDVMIDFTSPSLSSTEFLSGAPIDDAHYDRYHYNLVRSYWKISWVSRLVSGGKVKEFTLQKPDELSSESFGHLSEGPATFIAFADDNGNGEWDQGEPFGILRDVDIGWDRANVEIELTDDSPAFTRLDVAKLDVSVAAPAAEEGAADAAAPGATSSEPAEEDAPAVSNVLQRVRVVRTAINDQPLEKQRMVFAKLVDVSTRPWLAENDYIKPGHWDFDDRYLLSDAAKNGIAPASVLKVRYAVYVGDGLIDEVEPTTTWEKEFTLERVAPTVVSPSVSSGYNVLSAQPTLCWTGPKGYTAFAVEIATNADFSAGTVIYATTNFLPAATEAGYSLKAPMYAGKELAYGGKYWWRVCELNAKFATVGDWSAPGEFTMRADSTNADTGYGPVAAQIRYYGPSTNSQAQVIVGVYESADFTGLPVAQKVLGPATAGVTDLAYTAASADVDWTRAVTNVAFDGIAPGTYYVMAYVDANGNGVRDGFETWGYANGIGTAAPGAFYEPQAVKVLSTKSNLPSVVVYMEDTDCNQNEIPDCLEDPSLFAAAGGGDTALDSDSDGLSDKEEDYEIGTDRYVKDTDKDGMPDGWEVFAETDPLNADADTAKDGDVMAYEEVEARVVTVYNTKDGADVTTDYILKTDAKVEAGMDADQFELLSTWDYAGKFAAGTNVTLKAAAGTTNRVYAVKTDKVVYVHAQVYARNGFNPLTAVPGEDAVNTKPFTAIDKYLLGSYFQALGITNVVESADFWENWTLKPMDADCDLDGVADGWELYVMFGPLSTVEANMRISPWNFDDAATPSPAQKGLTLREEYDGGNLPTDPWNDESAIRGMSDAVAYQYGLKGPGGLRRDSDNDQLANFVEMVISKTPGLLQVDKDRMATSGKASGGDQVVPDYFLRVGSLYLGEMFTDHDFIEDWYEDEQPVEVVYGTTRTPNLSRFTYDAHLDPDQNGWSHWAEARAAIASGMTNLMVVATNGVGDARTVVTNWQEVSVYELRGGNPLPTVSVSLSYKGDLSGKKVYIRAWSQENPNDPQMVGNFDAEWVVDATSNHAFRANYVLGKADTGYLREGRNMFVVFADKTGDGAFQPGEPYGVIGDVDVSFLSGAPFSLELTDISPSILRVDFSGALGIQAEYADQWEKADVTALGLSITPEQQAKNDALSVECYNKVRMHCTDRGPNESSYAGTGRPTFVGTNTTFVSSNAVKVTVLRSDVNGLASSGGVPFDGIVLDRYLGLGEHPMLTEADLVAGGLLDLDWGTLVPKVQTTDTNWRDITNVTYRVVVFEGTLDPKECNNNLAVTIVNNFEIGPEQSATEPVGVTKNASRPTFSWKHQNAIGKPYPAFRLKVWDATGTTLVYDSGSVRAPARDKDGVYSWTAPLYSGMMTAQGHVFSAEANYVWDVSMLDAKFTEPLPLRQNPPTFRLNTSAAGGSSEYGRIAVAVKYMGPGAVSTTGVEGLVRVEAFTNPDFSGEPYGLGFVRHAATLAAPNVTELNAFVEGLPIGRTYYLRAFIDTNGNGRRDVWESWGYGNYVGTDRRDVYTPRPYELKGKTEATYDVPEAVIYIEDCDTNDDKVPDVMQWNKSVGTLSAVAAPVAPSPYTVGFDGTAWSASSVFTSLDKGVLKLPFYAALTQMENEDSLSAPSLALAMSGIDPSKLEVNPTVRIVRFSPTDGVEVEVLPRATLDGATLKPAVVTFSATLKLTLQHVDELTGTWEDVTTVSDTFSLSQDKTELDSAKLEALNNAIKAHVTGQSGFFQIKAEIVQ